MRAPDLLNNPEPLYKTSSILEVKQKMASKTNSGLAKDLSVGEVADRSGLAVSTLHFYESKGLITSWRTTGNQRRYSRDVLRRVAIIKVAQRTGVPLAAISEALKVLPADRSPTAQDWRKLSARWKEELDDRISKLTQLRDDLNGCIGCGCLSLKQCPLRNPDDEAHLHGPGARAFD